jgi:hypothetical protein
LIYSYSRPDDRDDALLEQKMKILQQLMLFYFCYHKGDRDPAAPSESQDSNGFPQDWPWRIVGGRETLDEGKIKAAEEEST